LPALSSAAHHLVGKDHQSQESCDSR